MARVVLGVELGYLDPEFSDTGTGQAAIDICRGMRAVDVVVLDLHRPELTGLDVLRDLAGLERAPCVVAWSADAIALQRAVKLGALVAVDKGGDAGRLVDAVLDCLRVRAESDSA
jgi:CheY-like chemotaxis protein